MNKDVLTEGAARCHLCGDTDKVMHGRSHVIPAWIFRQISSNRSDTLLWVDFDEFQEKLNAPNEYVPPVVSPRLGTPLDSTWYCTDCEKIFGKHDDFSAKFLKDPKNLGGKRARQRHIAATLQRPETLAIHHMSAWKWRQFVLSLIYRMHVSNHEQYVHVDIGAEPAERLREILLKDQYDGRLFEFDIVTCAAVRELADTDQAFVSPLLMSAEGGGFTACFAMWNLWIFVGYPVGSTVLSTLLPKDSHDTAHFVLISKEASIKWFMQSMGMDAAGAG